MLYTRALIEVSAHNFTYLGGQKDAQCSAECVIHDQFDHTISAEIEKRIKGLNRGSQRTLHAHNHAHTCPDGSLPRYMSTQRTIQTKHVEFDPSQ